MSGVVVLRRPGDRTTTPDITRWQKGSSRRRFFGLVNGVHCKPLRLTLASLDPLGLLHRIRDGQSALAAMRSGDFTAGADRKSLEEFLASLPELWREGEVRPTHRSATSAPRSYRTRKDPFESVWPEIVGWLQTDPDATAKSRMERLEVQFPGRFPAGQLRPLQRRVRGWRRVMAKTLVGNGVGADRDGEVIVIGTGTSM